MTHLKIHQKVAVYVLSQWSQWSEPEGAGRLRRLASWAIFVLVAIASSAQDGNVRSTQVMRSTSTLVIVPTLVRSQSGEPVKDLDADHFRLTDNGQEQNIYLEHVENQPIAVVVLIQTGGAASAELENYGKLDSVIESFLGASASKLALVSFDSQVRQTWAFPPRVDGLDYALTHQAVGDSGAAIRDAIRYGINLLQNQSAHFRRVILLLSQKQDSGSESNSTDILRDVARSGTTIYSFTFPSDAVGTKRPQHRTSDHAGTPFPTDATAAEVAVQSGGETVQFNGKNDLEQKMLTVRDGIRGGYILSFRPSSPSLGLHTIRVQVIDQTAGFKILARQSYWLD
jgi:VWFA-related protein